MIGVCISNLSVSWYILINLIVKNRALLNSFQNTNQWINCTYFCLMCASYFFVIYLSTCKINLLICKIIKSKCNIAMLTFKKIELNQNHNNLLDNYLSMSTWPNFMSTCKLVVMTCNIDMLTCKLFMSPCNLLMSTWNLVMLTCYIKCCHTTYLCQHVHKWCTASPAIILKMELTISTVIIQSISINKS